MPIKAEEALSFLSEYLDIQTDKVESIDQLRDQFGQVFARKDTYKQELLKDPSVVSSIAGKALGSISTKIKQLGKNEFGIEFEESETKDKTPEELAQIVVAKAKTKYETELNDIKSKFPKDASELEKEWQAKLMQANQNVEQWKTQASTAMQEFESFKSQVEQEKTNFKRNQAMQEAFGSVKFAPEANELVIEGFKAKINSEYKFDFDDQGNFTTFDKDGKVVFNPKKHDIPYSPAELLKDKAIELKIYQINEGGGRPAGGNNYTPPAPAKQADIPTRIVHPSALQ